MKKLLALSLALIMALGLIACGNSSTPAATSAGNAAAPAGDTKTDAPKGEILIGCLQDITGNTSALGKSVQAGAQAAVDEINANGGIGGQTPRTSAIPAPLGEISPGWFGKAPASRCWRRASPCSAYRRGFVCCT